MNTRANKSEPIDSMSLIAALRSGDKKAERGILDLIEGFSRYLCRVHGSGEPDWQDVAQEAARRFFMHDVHQFRPGGSLPGLLYSIVRGTRIQLYRSQARRKRREAVASPEPAGAPDPEKRTLLHRILIKLTPVCRELLERSFFDGASAQDLAAELGLAESSVRSRLSRCLAVAREIAGGILVASTMLALSFGGSATAVPRGVFGPLVSPLPVSRSWSDRPRVTTDPQVKIAGRPASFLSAVADTSWMEGLRES